MPFATDRDLLAYEPLLFRDVAWSAQRLLSAADAAISGSTLTVPSASFDDLGVGEGHVVVVAGVPLEVLERLSPTVLTVSRMRAAVVDDAIPPGDVEDATIVVATFLAQIGVVHGHLMRLVGLEPDDPERSPGVDDVLNPRAVAHVEALGALHLIFSAAAAVAGEGSALWMKAALHRERFAAARARAAVELHLGADGPAPAVSLRRFDAIRMVRS